MATSTAFAFSDPLLVWMILTVHPSALAITNSSPPSAAMSIPSLMCCPGAGFWLFVASSIQVEGMTRFPVTLGNSA